MCVDGYVETELRELVVHGFCKLAVVVSDLWSIRRGAMTVEIAAEYTSKLQVRELKQRHSGVCLQSVSEFIVDLRSEPRTSSSQLHYTRSSIESSK